MHSIVRIAIAIVVVSSAQMQVSAQSRSGAESRSPAQTPSYAQPRAPIFERVEVREGNVCGWKQGTSYCRALWQDSSEVTQTSDTFPQFTKVSGSIWEHCALDRTGAPSCWGWNYSGEAGTGVYPPQEGQHLLSPARVSGGHVFSSISVGNREVCALTQAGEAYCWGNGGDGQLGNDSIVKACHARQGERGMQYCAANAPFRISTTLRFAQISAGRSFNCAISVQHDAYCFGFSTRCVFRDCAKVSHTTPVLVDSTRKYIQISASYETVCAIAETHRAYCWGDNRAGQMGSPVVVDDAICEYGAGCSANPVEVTGNHLWRSIAVDYLNACGIVQDGSIWCWGARRQYQPHIDLTYHGELCRNLSERYFDVPCSTTPVRIDLTSHPGR